MEQDWESVTIRSKNPSVTTNQRSSQIKERRSTESIRLAKLDNNESIPSKTKTLSSDSRKDLVAARVALKKSQVEMDRLCAFPAHTFREVEAGRLTPVGATLNRMNRELKISLHLE